MSNSSPFFLIYWVSSFYANSLIPHAFQRSDEPPAKRPYKRRSGVEQEAETIIAPSIPPPTPYTALPDPYLYGYGYGPAMYEPYSTEWSMSSYDGTERCGRWNTIADGNTGMVYTNLWFLDYYLFLDHSLQLAVSTII